MFLKNLKRNSFYIILAFISAFLISYITTDFRYSNFRWIYHTGWVSCYLLHFISIIFSMINSMLIVAEKMKRREKVFFPNFKFNSSTFLGLHNNFNSYLVMMYFLNLVFMHTKCSLKIYKT
jgi:hypothetical protein